jgi:hypothetical protein
MRKMMGLTREEKENLVLDLYYIEGKTYAEIAKEARISLRDIGPILKKSGSEQSLSNSSLTFLKIRNPLLAPASSCIPLAPLSIWVKIVKRSIV